MAWHYHVQTSKTWYRPNTSKENYFETSKYCCFMSASIEQSFTSCSDYTFPFQSHRLLILVILKIFFFKGCVICHATQDENYGTSCRSECMHYPRYLRILKILVSSSGCPSSFGRLYPGNELMHCKEITKW